MEDRLRQMIHDFGRALSVAISGSPEASESLKEIHQQGYSLYLLFGSEDSDLGEGRLTLTLPGDEPTATQADAEGEGSATETTSRQASFRINGKDLMFFKSVGIDPTRSLKRRRSG